MPRKFIIPEEEFMITNTVQTVTNHLHTHLTTGLVLKKLVQNKV